MDERLSFAAKAGTVIPLRTEGSATPDADAPSLPTGTVTFLLTDIEGSTRRWEARGPEMTAAVARHYEILDAAIARHGGVRPVEQGEGDSVVAASRAPRTPFARRWTLKARSSARSGPRAATSPCAWLSTPERPRSAIGASTPVRS